MAQNKNDKISLNKGDTFIGKIERVATGEGSNGPWRAVHMVALTPFGMVQPGGKCVWFTPKGKDYEPLVQGNVVQISRPDRKYVVETADGVDNPTAAKALANAPGPVAGGELSMRIAGAFSAALDTAVWYNRRLLKMLDDLGLGKETEEYFFLYSLRMQGEDVRSLAIHLLIGQERGEYDIPAPRSD